MGAQNRHKLLLEQFVRRFLVALGKPNAEHPSTRCLLDVRVRNLVNQVKRSLQADRVVGYSAYTTQQYVEHMEKLGLVRVVQTSRTSGDSEDGPIFYVVGTEDADQTPQHIELLLAYRPQGVICYFSALVLHNLTTQPPAFHHSCILEDKESRKEAAAETQPNHSGSVKKRLHADPLGTLAFVHGGVPCYTTRRTRKLVPGIQTRYLDSKTIIKVTNREQTLLDTLHMPTRCGGPEVVMEAWQTAIEEWDEDILTDQLDVIGIHTLARRVGAMLDLLDYNIHSDRLKALLEHHRESAQIHVPLFAGFPLTNLNKQWGILLP